MNSGAHGVPWAVRRVRYDKAAMKLRKTFATAVVAAFAVCGAPFAPAALADWTPPRTPAMVAAANPHATAAGLEILGAGGNAMDAAVAVQAVLGLVEPQSSGIGGGAFLLHWDAPHRRLDTYDGRETAPAGVTADALFLAASGERLKYHDAAVGGVSVGVPGTVAMLHLAHREHGHLPWSRLFVPAMRLAKRGFALSPRLHELLSWSPGLPKFPQPRALYFQETPAAETAKHGATPLPVGTLLQNPEYACSLERIAAEGHAAFYTGALAERMVAAVHNAPRPGTLDLADIAAYRAVKREPLCRRYRAWQVCGMPPPTSGGVTTLAILGILERFDMASLAPGSVQAVHLLSEASRLAYADRDRYIGDPDFTAVPVAAMLSPPYLARRAGLIGLRQSLGPDPVAPGEFTGGGSFHRMRFHDNVPVSRPSTTHFSIVDHEGNAVSMTSSVEGPFGSHLMAGGFFLNNQLTDFSFLSGVDGRPVANAVAPGKRPRSSMSPTMVFDGSGRLYAALGSPGGSRIIAYVTQALVALLDWQMDMQSAIALPRHANRNGPTDLEEGTALQALTPALEALGHEVRARRMTSGLHGIRITATGPDGGADPRREGSALRVP